MPGDPRDFLKGYSNLLSSYAAGAAKTSKQAASPSVRRSSYELPRWSDKPATREKLHAHTPDSASRSQLAEQKHIMRQASITDNRRVSDGSRPSTAVTTQSRPVSRALSRTRSNAAATEQSRHSRVSQDAYKGKSGSRPASPTSRGRTSAAPAVKASTIAAYKPATYGRSSLSGTQAAPVRQSTLPYYGAASGSSSLRKTGSGIYAQYDFQGSSATYNLSNDDYSCEHQQQQESQEQQQKKNRGQAGAAYLDSIKSSASRPGIAAAAPMDTSMSMPAYADHSRNVDDRLLDSSCEIYDRGHVRPAQYAASKYCDSPDTYQYAAAQDSGHFGPSAPSRHIDAVMQSPSASRQPLSGFRHLPPEQLLSPAAQRREDPHRWSDQDLAHEVSPRGPQPAMHEDRSARILEHAPVLANAPASKGLTGDPLSGLPVQYRNPKSAAAKATALQPVSSRSPTRHVQDSVELPKPATVRQAPAEEAQAEVVTDQPTHSGTTMATSAEQDRGVLAKQQAECKAVPLNQGPRAAGISLQHDASSHEEKDAAVHNSAGVAPSSPLASDLHAHAEAPAGSKSRRRNSLQQADSQGTPQLDVSQQQHDQPEDDMQPVYAPHQPSHEKAAASEADTQQPPQTASHSAPLQQQHDTPGQLAGFSTTTLQHEHHASHAHTQQHAVHPQHKADTAQLQDQASAVHTHLQPALPQPSHPASPASRHDGQASDAHTQLQPMEHLPVKSAISSSCPLLHAYLQQSAGQAAHTDKPDTASLSQHEQDPHQQVYQQQKLSHCKEVSSQQQQQQQRQGEPKPPKESTSVTVMQQQSGGPDSHQQGQNSWVKQHLPVSVKEAQQCAAKLAASVKVAAPVQQPASSEAASQSMGFDHAAAQSRDSPNSFDNPLGSACNTNDQLQDGAAQLHEDPVHLHEGASQHASAVSSDKVQQQLPVAGSTPAVQTSTIQQPDRAHPDPQFDEKHDSLALLPPEHQSNLDNLVHSDAHDAVDSSRQAVDLQEQTEIARALLASMQEQPSSPAHSAGQVPDSPAQAQHTSRPPDHDYTPSSSIVQAAYTDSYASPEEGDDMGFYADSPASSKTRSSSSSGSGHSKNRSLKSKSGHRYTSRNQSPVPMQISPDIHVGPQKTPQRSSRSQSPAVIHASPSSSMPSSPARTHSQSPGRQNPRGTAPVPSSASPHLAEPSPGTAAQMAGDAALAQELQQAEMQAVGMGVPSDPEGTLIADAPAPSTQEAEPPQEGAIDLAALQDVEVPLVGSQLPLATLLEDYEGSPRVRGNLMPLLQRFPYFRRIKGDGNCFYRAFIVGLLEELAACHSRRQYSQALHAAEHAMRAVLELRGFDQRHLKYALKGFEYIKEPPRMQPLSALVYADFEHCEFESTPDKDIATTEPTVTMSPAQAAIELYIECLYQDPARLDDVLDHMCDPHHDRCIIKYLRAITALELNSQQDHYALFIPGIDAYQGLELIEIIFQAVLPMDAEVEHLQVKALVALFPVRLKVLDVAGSFASVYTFDPQADEAGPDASPERNPQQALQKLWLIYRPGHYEVVYPAEGFEDLDKL